MCENPNPPPPPPGDPGFGAGRRLQRLWRPGLTDCEQSQPGGSCPAGAAGWLALLQSTHLLFLDEPFKAWTVSTFTTKGRSLVGVDTKKKCCRTPVRLEGLFL